MSDKQEKEFFDKLGSRTKRLNSLYWILDEKGNKIRFRMNRVQQILYQAMWWLNVIPKSRQHGITTFICLFFLDACLFNLNVRAGIIAHRLDDAERIFQDKVKFAYDNLPIELRDRISLENETKTDLMFSNGSYIYVSTSMRSGTLQYLHISEYGYTCVHAPDKASEIKRGSLPTIHEGGIIFIESTSEGIGNDFHAICEEAEKHRLSGKPLSRLDFRIHFFAWHDNPANSIDPMGTEISRKMEEYYGRIEQVFNKRLTDGQKAWYIGQKKIYGADIYKEHPSTLSEAFEAASEGTYHGIAMALATEKARITFVPYDPSAKVFTFWDTGNIYTSIWFFQFKGERINAINHYFDDLGQGLPHYATVLQEKHYVYGGHFAGPDIDPEHGSNRKSFHTGETTIDEALRLGIKFEIVEAHSFDDRIRATNEMIARTYFDENECKSGILGLKNFRRRKNTQLSTTERPVFFDEPVRDTIDIHIADSFGHMAIWYKAKLIRGQNIGDAKPQTQDYHSYRNKQHRHVALSGFKSEKRRGIA